MFTFSVVPSAINDHCKTCCSIEVKVPLSSTQTETRDRKKEASLLIKVTSGVTKIPDKGTS